MKKKPFLKLSLDDDENENQTQNPCPPLSFNDILEKHNLTETIKEDIRRLNDSLAQSKKSRYNDILLHKMLNEHHISNHRREVDVFVDNNVNSGRNYNLLVYESGDEIIKAFVYAENSCSSFIEILALREIAFINKAQSLNRTCNFFSPRLLDFGKICLRPEQSSTILQKIALHEALSNLDQNICILYFVMEKLHAPTLEQLVLNYNFDDKQINDIVIKVRSLVECLNENSIYHNDETFQNIMFDLENQKPGLIDFGLSGELPDSSLGAFTHGTYGEDFTVNYFKKVTQRLRNNKKKGTLESTFGGRRKRKRKTKNNRRRKTITKKAKRQSKKHYYYYY
jgi:tRNA A-37 threonylcarbamoyl transferase component Bud32